jgi:predicted kinase
MNNEPILLLLIGIPGSGKSTWLAGHHLIPAPLRLGQDEDKFVIVNSFSFTVICPDMIRQSLSDISDQSQNILVWQEAKTRTMDLLERGMNVILDATNVNTSRRREFLTGLPTCKKMAKMFYVNPETAYQRIKKDLEENKLRSNVPEEAVYRLYGEYLYTLRVIKSEGFEIHG